MTDIKSLNDNFRKSFNGGKVLLTTGINAKSQKEVAEILNQVRCFNSLSFAREERPQQRLVVRASRKRQLS